MAKRLKGRPNKSTIRSKKLKRRLNQPLRKNITQPGTAWGVAGRLAVKTARRLVKASSKRKR